MFRKIPSETLNERLAMRPEKVFPFGKHQGKTFTDVAESDPGYLRWILDNTDFGADHADTINETLRVAELARLDKAPEIDLTDHQQERADKVLFAIEEGANVVRLEGGAGYGKSYVTKEIGSKLRRRGVEVRGTAVSYVATQVLAQQLDPLGIECTTLARTLRFTVEYDKGEEIYLHSPDTSIEAGKLLAPRHALIVDECSMVGDRDAELLISTAAKAGGHLILVGDSHQLPPVKQNHFSKCCDPLPTDHVAELTVPMRYSRDSHLYSIERETRNAFRDSRIPVFSALAFPSPELTLVRDMDEMFQRYGSYYREDPGAVHRMLLFRRKDVTDANNRIREQLFGVSADIIEKNEQIMVLRTGDTPYGADQEDTVRYYSGQTFKVLEKWQEKFALEIDGIEYEIPHWVVQLDDNRPAVRIIFGVTESLMDSTKLGGLEFQHALAAAREYGLENREWGYYRQLLMDFVRIAYQYATSVHRAQGQTVDYAYCHPASLSAVKGLLGRTLPYVALTRAKKHLTIL